MCSCSYERTKRGPAAGHNYNNSTTCQQQISKSNKSPIVILSDKVYSYNNDGNPKTSLTVNFHKAYKAMKLCYNNTESAAGTQPVNRQLYMAVILDQAGDTSTDPQETQNIQLSYCSTCLVRRLQSFLK